MGQQQLLLLVLGIALVGFSVVGGIEALTENQRKSELDRYTDMGIAMIGDMIAYYQKSPTQGGAGEDASQLGTLSLVKLGFREDVSDTWNGFPRSGVIENGIVRFVVADETHPFVHIHEWPLATGDTVLEVHAFGPSADCLIVRSARHEVTDWTDGTTGGTAPDAPTGCSW